MNRSLFFLLLFINARAMSQSRIQGEYYFRKQEMVAGFNFAADGKFQFFFSYGAVDRNATGTFTVQGDTLRIKSDKPAGKDFTITSQSREGSGYTIVFDDPNKYLVNEIRCFFFVNGKPEEIFSDNNGEAHTNIPHCDTIYVQHQLYPDVVTLIKDAGNNNNHFRLSLNPSLAQVSFKGIDFKIIDDKTIGCLPNYLMDIEDIEFEKE